MAAAATPPLADTIWVYLKEDTGEFRVFPSPKGVSQGDPLYFTNLTKHDVMVVATGTLAPATLAIKAWPGNGSPPHEKASASGPVGAHRYAITVKRAGKDGQDKQAQGGSDPDIIINP
jgi:hypothetical protein